MSDEEQAGFDEVQDITFEEEQFVWDIELIPRATPDTTSTP